MTTTPKRLTPKPATMVVPIHDVIIKRWLYAIDYKTHQPGLTIPAQQSWTGALMHVAALIGDFEWDYDWSHENYTADSILVEQALGQSIWARSVVVPEEEAWRWRLVIEKCHRDRELGASIDATYRLGGIDAVELIITPMIDDAERAWDRFQAERRRTRSEARLAARAPGRRRP